MISGMEVKMRRCKVTDDKKELSNHIGPVMPCSAKLGVRYHVDHPSSMKSINLGYT